MRLKRFKENKGERSRLKMEIVSTFKVKIKDLEKFIKEVYDFNYDTLGFEDFDREETDYGFIDGDLSRIEDEDLESFREGITQGDIETNENRWMPDVVSLLEILCSDGLIPSGDYKIIVPEEYVN